MIRGGLVDAAAAPRRCLSLLQLGALGGEADLGKAQEDQAEDWRGILLGLEPGVGAVLVGGVPQALFECRRGGIFFSWRNSAHAIRIRPPKLADGGSRLLWRNPQPSARSRGGNPENGPNRSELPRLALPHTIQARKDPPTQLGFCQTDQPSTAVPRSSLSRSSMVSIRSSLRSRWTS